MALEGESSAAEPLPPAPPPDFGVPLPDDPFGEVPAGPAEPPATAPAATEVEDLEMLFEEGAAGVAGAGSGYRIRHASGKVVGPFPESEIAQMVVRGEFNGNEEVAPVPGDEFIPMGRVPAFAEALRKATEGPVSGAAGRGDQPALSQLTVSARAGRRHSGRGAAVVALLVLAAVGGAGYGAGYTRFGPFFRNLWSRGPDAGRSDSKARPPPPPQPLDEARMRLLEERAESVEVALSSADEALRKDPKNRGAAGLYCQSAAWLAAHGASGSLPRAKQILAELTARAPSDPSTLAAQVALAVATQSLPSVGAALGDLERHAKSARPPDELALALLGDAALARKDLARASEWFQKLEGLRPGPRSSHGLGAVALAQRDFAAARRLFGQALERDARHQISALPLAQALDLGEPKDTARSLALLRGAVAAEGPARLTPHDRTLARVALADQLLRGGPAAEPDLAEAQKELEAALEEDPAHFPARMLLARTLLRNGAADRAAALLAQAQGDEAKGPEVTALRARALAASGRLFDALTAVDEALARVAGSPPLLFTKGFILARTGKSQEAQKLFQDAIDRDPTLWQARLALGRAAMRENDLVRAEKELRVAQEKAPGEPEVHAGLGDLAQAKKNWPDAEESYRKALALDPGLAEAHLGLARVLLAKGDPAGAEASAKKTVELDPRIPEAELLLADLLLAKKDLSGAHKGYEAAAKLEPRNAVARARLGAVTFQEGQLDAALAALNEAANLDPRLADAHHWLGRALVGKGDRVRGIEHLTRATELAPEVAAYHLELGKVKEAGNAFVDAVRAYETALARDPKLVEAHERLAVIYGSQNRCDQAAAHVEKGLALAPRNQRLRAELGDCRAQLQDYAGALRLYREAQKADPDLPGIDYRIARALHRSAGAKEAFPHYERALQRDPANPMPHYYLGYAYKERGDKSQAIQEFKAFLRAKPDAEERKDVEQEIEDLGGRLDPR